MKKNKLIAPILALVASLVGLLFIGLFIILSK